MINRCAETVYRVYRYLETGASIADYQDHYMRNKQRCGRKRTQLLLAELTYINDKIAQGWTPDTIIGWAERPISCNLRTLYRMFERGQFGFDVRSLPMRGKRHPNGYVERRGKAGQ
ncbi:IS30 family transposase, partial [Limosilactobacillus reuteri]|nr:IS30 family transposase [Limosilactobacillus reuteri]